MKKEKLIIFDWGGVIESHLDNEYSYKIIYKKILKNIGVKDIPSNYLEKLSSCNYDENGNHIFSQFGYVSTNNYIKRIYNEFGIEYEMKDIHNFKKMFEKEFGKSFYYKDISSFIKDLSNECYVGVLSNLIALDEKRIKSQIDFDYLDFKWLSFEMGMYKPNDDIFLEVLKESKFDPSNIMFLDDNEENIKTAKRLGFYTYLVKGYDFENIKRFVEDFLNS